MEMLVIVNDSPLRSYSSLAALRFCRAASRRGHVVCQVFFYLDGVYHQLDVNTNESAEPDLVYEWQQFAASCDTELVLCAAASHRRIRSQLPVPAEFREGSLVEMLDLATRVDRMLSFGGP